MRRRLPVMPITYISPMLVLPNNASDADRMEIEEDRKLLMALFAAYPDRNYFNSYQSYRVGNTTIQLRSPLLKRNKLIDGSATPLTKYDVLGVELAHGSFGAVYPVIGTLTLRRNNLSYQADGNHVVKLSADYNTSDTPELFLPNIKPTSQNKALEEMRTMQDVGRFNPKREVTQEVGDHKSLTFITTRRFTGMPLSTIIKDRPLTTEQRLQLSIALLRALKEQIDDKNIIHRDIKPENIIVDLETMEVNIIDVGLGTSKRFPDIATCGTPGYIAPEIARNVLAAITGKTLPVTEKADIFSMSRTLAKLWGEYLGYWKKMNTNNMLYNSMTFEFIPENLFKHPKTDQFKNISKSVKDYIGYVLALSAKQNPAERPDIDQLIALLEKLYIHITHNKENQPIKDALLNAFSIGFHYRSRLLVAPDGATFIQIFDNALKETPDNKSALDELIRGLGWNSLRGVNNKDEMRERAISIVNQYKECAQRHIQILEHAETIRNKLIVKNSIVSAELDEFILEITHKITRINDKPFDLDFLQKSIERLNQNAADWHARLDALQNSERYQMIKSIVQRLELPLDEPRPAQPARADAVPLEPANPAPNREFTPLETLKLNLMFAIRKYVRDTTSDVTLNKKKRAASTHRMKDIEDLTAIINDAQTPEVLLKNTKARIGKMRYSLFGRSELRRNIEAVIEHHTAAMKAKK